MATAAAGVQVITENMAEIADATREAHQSARKVMESSRALVA